ncbi:MAG: RNA-guided pseudouridylation complex pseudouridine synthase subunit Cbf5 [Nanoarchaeota archaeon]
MEELLPFEKIKRKILLKKEAETSREYGISPEDRSTKELINYGIINLNKSDGPTSHQVSDYVQKILNIKKAGHSGTLDPGVTGVLPIALGRATRIVEYLLKAGKEYVCLMHLHKPISEDLIKKTFEEFTGKIKQLPPIKSAVKRVLREREIYYVNILETKNQDVLFKIGCQAGTYIRKFVHDFGQKLKIGAHMSQLVRTKVATFTDKDWITLYDLKDAYEFYKQGDEKQLRKCILPIEKAVEHLPKIWVFDTTVDSLCHGAQLSIPGISKLESEIKEKDIIAILTLKNELICIGTAMLNSEEILKNMKGIVVKVNKVFMKEGTYPKYTKNSL